MSDKVETALINLLNTGWRVECYYNPDTDDSDGTACVLISSSSEVKLFKKGFHEDAIVEAYEWTKHRREAPLPRPDTFYYFGCLDALGHHLWTSDLKLVHPKYAHESRVPWSLAELDGQLAPRVTGLTQEAAQPQGQALVHHKDGWTAVAFWDRSVDSRPNANSVFILKGTFDFEDAMKRAVIIFPQIVSRLDITEFNPNTRD